MADAAARARSLGHTLSPFRRFPALDSGSLTVYVATCEADQSEWCYCEGEVLVTVHNDRYNLNRVHAHGSALQYDHKALRQVAYDESSAPR
jgi:hypothetical protein